jgi:catechol 2,3-dioxygenase
LRRLRDAGYPIDGFNDHGTHEAIYLRDPEENGLELCWDRPVEEWDRDAEGHYGLGNRRLDLTGLLHAGE